MALTTSLRCLLGTAMVTASWSVAAFNTSFGPRDQAATATMQALGNLFGGSVALRSSVGDLHNDCSGTYLSNGYVLTAAHCFNLPDDVVENPKAPVSVRTGPVNLMFTGASTWPWLAAQGDGTLYRREVDSITNEKTFHPASQDVAFSHIEAVARLDADGGPDLALVKIGPSSTARAFGATAAQLADQHTPLPLTNLQPLYTPVGVQVGERIIGIAVGHSNGLIDTTPFSPPTDERLRLGSYALLQPSVRKDAEGHAVFVQTRQDIDLILNTNLIPPTNPPPTTPTAPAYHPARSMHGTLRYGDSGGGLFMPTALGPTLIGVAAGILIDCKGQKPCPDLPSIEDHWTSVGAYRSDIDSAVQLLDQVLAMAPGTDPLRPRMAASAMETQDGLVRSTFEGLTAGTVHWLGLSTGFRKLHELTLLNAQLAALDFGELGIGYLEFFTPGKDGQYEPAAVTISGNVVSFDAPVSAVQIRGWLFDPSTSAATLSRVIGVETVGTARRLARAASPLDNGMPSLVWTSSVTAVPEPAAWMLVAGAMLVLGLRSRSRQAAPGERHHPNISRANGSP